MSGIKIFTFTKKTKVEVLNGTNKELRGFSLANIYSERAGPLAQEAVLLVPRRMDGRWGATSGLPGGGSSLQFPV